MQSFTKSSKPGTLNDQPTDKVMKQLSLFLSYILLLIERLLHQKVKLKKYVYRLIVMFLPTEIFSKRRKIYSWMKRNQSDLPTAHGPTISYPKSKILVYLP